MKKIKVSPTARFAIWFTIGILLICIVEIMTGCVTEKQRLKICNGCPVKTVIHDSIVLKHDTVPFYLPGKDGPTVYLENPCKELCDSLGNLKKVDKKTNRNGLRLHITTQGNGLNITTASKDTTLKAPVTTTQTFHSKKDTEVKWLQCDKPHKTEFDGFCRWFFYIAGPTILIYIVCKFYFRLPI